LWSLIIPSFLTAFNLADGGFKAVAAAVNSQLQNTCVEVGCRFITIQVDVNIADITGHALDSQPKDRVADGSHYCRVVLVKSV